MDIVGGNSPQANVDGSCPQTDPSVSSCDLLADLEYLRRSKEELRSKSGTAEAELFQLQDQRDKATDENKNNLNDELSRERETLHAHMLDIEASFKEKESEIDEKSRRNDELKEELEVYRKRIEKLEAEKAEESGFWTRYLDLIRLLKDCLLKIIESLNDDGKKSCLIENSDDGNEAVAERQEELREIWRETKGALRLAMEAESTFKEDIDSWKKERKQLESSLVSLTEENRDISDLVRVALVEKEAMERKMKGNSEQKRVPLLQFAERGFQRVVGFGFMMGSGAHEHSIESSGTAVAVSAIGSSKSESSDCEEEVVDLASTVERIMKNLRLEISQLRRSLEESRSDNERLQSLTEKQARTIEENMMYISELEDRERVLSQNVEELLAEIKETEAEVTRWREACELEVEAGKHEIEEREKLIVILKQELEKTKAVLDISTGKLKLKEELVSAAITAQSAAETSLRLADGRAEGLRNRIEELTKQLEEAETRERSRRKLRHICWPWRALKATRNTNNRSQTARHLLPEMRALLHHHRA